MIARIAGVELNGLDQYQRSLYTIYADELKGWLDGVGVRDERIPIPHQHGDFDLPVYRDARLVIIRGQINTRNEIDQEKAVARLLGICADGQDETLSVETAAGTTWARVRLGDKPDIRITKYGRYATYRLTFRAPDPRRYGELRPFTDEPVWHRGNARATPVLIVSGANAAGWTVTGPGGRRIVCTRALAAGSPHRLDLATGRLTVAGSRVQRALPTFQPWAIPPGSPITQSITAGLSLRTEVRDTYL